MMPLTSLFNSILKLLKFKNFKRLILCSYSSSGSCKFTRRVFSGVQPTGVLHLGNYLGAVQPWVTLQHRKDLECIFSIVDLHAITLPQDPQTLRNNILLMTASLLACGLDPDKCLLFQQSDIPEHTELCWILGCLVTMARLTYLPQYKEKSSKQKDGVPLGIYIYPVLQAADILAYKATDVPVGEDQLQHLQLAHQLATTFNKRFGHTFPIPKTIIPDAFSKRLRSLRDPKKKMSKSDPDPRSRIEIMDPPDVIHAKFKKAVTDSVSTITYDPEERPGVSNLIDIHSMFDACSPEEICTRHNHLNTAEYKATVAEAVVRTLTPVQLRVKELMREPDHLRGVLRLGAKRAQLLATDTLRQVKKAVGFTV